MSRFIDHQKVAIYVRVSTHWQIDKDSLPVQKAELTNYSKYVLSIPDFYIFEDAGYSAKNTDRPAFQQMMSRLRTGEFSHLLVWKIDRISRNLLDFAQMYQELKTLGVTFVSKNEQFDTSSAMGEAMLKIILVFAELERQMTSERVTAVMMSRATNGQWNGGKIPYGYCYDKETGVFSEEPQEAGIVRLMFSTYVEERSLLKVSRLLNDRGVKTRSGNPWSPVTIRIILTNPFYTGTYRYNYRNETKGKRDWSIKDENEWISVEDHHLPLVSEALWAEAGKILNENQRSNAIWNSSYNRKNVNIFAGLMTCGECGGNMVASVGKVRKDGYRPTSYNCCNRRRTEKCTNKYISDLTVGPFFLNFVANLIKASDSFGKTTSIETLQKKLLRGDLFKDVECIERPGLEQLYDHLRSGFSGLEYQPSPSADMQQENAKERDLLLASKHQKERALNRLHSLFLYSEDSMSEKDYYTERKALQDEIEAISSRIAEIDESVASRSSLTDEEFIEKASYFLISQNLQDKRSIDFEKTVRTVSPKILKIFVQNIAQNFCIKNGQISSITFRNGLSVQFRYIENGQKETPDD